jgi:hypothetical protein
MNNIIRDTKIDLNIKKIKEIVFESQFLSDKNLDASHHRIVANYDYLREIQSQYPFLSDTYNIYTLPGNNNIPLHIDAQRSAAFNIPIKNTEESETIFYRYIDQPNLEYDAKNIFFRIKSEVEEIFKFTLITPTLINNSIPHMVVNKSSEPRIILSWSVKKEFKFEDIQDRL